MACRLELNIILVGANSDSVSRLFLIKRMTANHEEITEGVLGFSENCGAGLQRYLI